LNQAYALTTGAAFWNVPNTGFGTQQAAAFTFVNDPVNNTSILLKGSGNFGLTFQRHIRVRYNAGQIIIDSSTNSGFTYTTAATLPVSLVAGNRLTAMVDATGKVTVWKTAGTVDSIIGSATIGTFTGTGSIGMNLPTNARVDDFAGGSVQ